MSLHPVINDVVMHAGDSDAVNHLLARVLLFLFFFFSLFFINCYFFVLGLRAAFMKWSAISYLQYRVK